MARETIIATLVRLGLANTASRRRLGQLLPPARTGFLPCQLEQRSVLDPGRAYGLARAAPDAPVYVELKGGRSRVEATLHHG